MGDERPARRHPALTTRGMGTAEMARVGDWMAEVLDRPDDEALAARVRGEIEEFSRAFPLPYAEQA